MDTIARGKTFLWELFVDSLKVTIAGGLGGMAFYFMQSPRFFHSLGGILSTVTVGMVLIALIRVITGEKRPV